MRAWTVVGVVVVLVVVLALWAPRADACLSVSVGDTSAGVAIASERALIAWDPTTHTEHFVRTVSFDTRSSDVGFIVPVPAVPEVAEAEARVFERLGRVVRPPPPEDGVALVDGAAWPWLGYGRLRSGWLLGASVNALGGESTDDTGARLERSLLVAGFEVSVLSADSPAALAAWLAAHHYAQPAGFEGWAGHYVALRWHFVAFRMSGAPGPAKRGLDTRAIRISVKTDAPYYPYLEPPAPPPSFAAPRWGRSGVRLELFVVSPEPLSGSVGAAPWAAQRRVAARLPLGDALFGAVPRPDRWEGAWLDQYEDRAFDRPAADLFFQPAPDTEERRPPPPEFYGPNVLLIRWPGLLLLLAPLGGLLWRWTGGPGRWRAVR